jgi:hypothetical protein
LAAALNGLRSPDPEARRRAAVTLGVLADRRAVEPLLVLLTTDRVATSRLRILPALEPVGAAPLRDPQSIRQRCAYHAAQVRSGRFLTAILSHRRAHEWGWVRTHNAAANPPALLDRLRSALTSRPLGGADFEVTLRGDDPSVTPMLSLLMTLYERDARTRAEQRALRIDCETRLPRARTALADGRQLLDGFLRTSNLPAVRAEYEARRNRAAPLLERKKDAESDLADAERDQDDAESDLKDARDKRDEITSDLKSARDSLAYWLNRRPIGVIDPNVERQIDYYEGRVRDLTHDLAEQQRRVDRAREALSDAEDEVDDAEDDVEDLEARIQRIMGDAGTRYLALQARHTQLTRAVRDAQTAVDSLQRALAGLPPMSQLAAADTRVRVVRRPAGTRPAAEPLAVRLAVLAALGRIGDLRAAPALVRQLRNPDPRLHAPAAAALKQITGKDFGTDPARWEAHLAARKSP